MCVYIYFLFNAIDIVLCCVTERRNIPRGSSGNFTAEAQFSVSTSL